MEQDVIAMQEIFQFQQSGINEAGKVVGAFKATGVRPKCADRIAAAGRQLPMDMFSHMHAVNQARPERRF
jgi:pilus assembly protein CpaF